MKRTFDVATAVLLLILLAPIMLAIGLLIWWRLGNPVFFGQVRAGYLGAPFWMIKFRTMQDARDHNGKLLPDKYRLTKLGAFLRASSLDELPGLWSVLIGDMSLVGPRPLLMEYLPLYTPEQARRHQVYPGITGWAQVNGRNAISWQKKFELDVWYVDNRSLQLDFKILWLTIKKVLMRDGINAKGDVSMPFFKGNDDR